MRISDWSSDVCSSDLNYMIMQGYDFTELNRRYGTVLQMGGSDQWGNIIHGVDPNHRMGGAQLYALTTPLLTKASGEKMGKRSEQRWVGKVCVSTCKLRWSTSRNKKTTTEIKKK